MDGNSIALKYKNSNYKLYFLQSAAEPMEQFLSIVMEYLDKNWFDFNTTTQDALVQVAGHVMNSKAGIKLSGAYRLLLLLQFAHLYCLSR